jgi:hypothetical protein
MDVDDLGILCLAGFKEYATLAFKESQSIGPPKMSIGLLLQEPY